VIDRWSPGSVCRSDYWSSWYQRQNHFPDAIVRVITTSSVQAGLPTPTGLANDADVGGFKGHPTGQDERCAILRPDTRSFYFKKNTLAAFFH